MKVAKFMGHITIIVICCLLTVSAETLDATRHLQKQQQQQQQHTKHLQHQQHHNSHHHQQHHRQHLTKLRQHLASSTGVGTPIAARQSRKLDLQTPLATQASTHHQQLHVPQKPLENPNSQVELIDNSNNQNNKNIIPKNATATALTAVAPATSTKLRRLSAKDYYNKSVQRRYNTRRNVQDDWAYNTYNVHTNTFGPTQTQSHAGKGDDNSDDVEFVSSTGAKSMPDWSRRGYVPSLVPTSGPTRKTTTSTQAPPAMVPARRGYPTGGSAAGDAPSTEDPFETNVISRNPSGVDSKDMEK